MAAKVAMVAVPTVLGIASIRVYTVREAPTDGLMTREKLNVYTPLPQSAQAQFVPEKPGVIQSGLTTVRESVQPFYHTVKGSCFSVKNGSVNLYHAGEDLFYYLKDPPPEFLPRFGTITMAGLLGMFLVRKGSRFKRVAIPLGLMTAGASVCYPAQAVAVLKVTGKKVYAAGKWSSAAVSSLLTSKPQEPVATEIAASQPQAATVPNPESAVVEEASEASPAQSSTIPQTEVESAESVPVSDVITKEASSVTLAEISPDQTLTESNTDPVAHSVPEETKTTTTSEEISAPVESEEPSEDVKDVTTEASPAESTPNLELETVEAAPEEAAPAETAPVEVAPAESPEVKSVSIEEPPAAKASDEPAVPAVESAEPEPAPQPQLADPPQVATVETLTPTLTPSPPQQPATENSKGGSGFKADPALMDFGQSSPEDEDLYSTRS